MNDEFVILIITQHDIRTSGQVVIRELAYCFCPWLLLQFIQLERIVQSKNIFPAIRRHLLNIGLMLAHRLQLCANIKPILGKSPVFIWVRDRVKHNH